MYWIPVGMFYGADVSVVELLFLDLLPATLGNVIGGGLGMGTVYWYLCDATASRAQLTSKIHEAFHVGSPTSLSNADQEG